MTISPYALGRYLARWFGTAKGPACLSDEVRVVHAVRPTPRRRQFFQTTTTVSAGGTTIHAAAPNAGQELLLWGFIIAAAPTATTARYRLIIEHRIGAAALQFVWAGVVSTSVADGKGFTHCCMLAVPLLLQAGHTLVMVRDDSAFGALGECDETVLALTEVFEPAGQADWAVRETPGAFPAQSPQPV